LSESRFFWLPTNDVNQIAHVAIRINSFARTLDCVELCSSGNETLDNKMGEREKDEKT
jgi:hypothetical protein